MIDAPRVQAFGAPRPGVVIDNKSVYPCAPIEKTRESDSDERLRNLDVSLSKPIKKCQLAIRRKISQEPRRGRSASSLQEPDFRCASCRCQSLARQEAIVPAFQCCQEPFIGITCWLGSNRGTLDRPQEKLARVRPQANSTIGRRNVSIRTRWSEIAI